MKVKLCRDCKYAAPEKDSSWSLLCTNPEVNSKDYFMLSGASQYGSSARFEREKKWFTPCGMKGKLWEPKEKENS
jgi:hypothetical protein